uniref:Uncharacterized protein n=1 Tax=Nelumbo nucifera TaxID=4432 RepID=A0A822ZPW1_NELNU|nr:TPA_asm: hypothetical protein HUJ06_017961 [Nelumbo nucifera]
MYTSNEDEPSTQLRSNMFSLSGAGFFGAVGRSINLGKCQFRLKYAFRMYFFSFLFFLTC